MKSINILIYITIKYIHKNICHDACTGANIPYLGIYNIKNITSFIFYFRTIYNS